MIYIYPVKKICYYLCLLVICPDFRIVTATTENMKGFSAQFNNGVQQPDVIDTWIWKIPPNTTAVTNAGPQPPNL